MGALDAFHPRVRGWFENRFAAPTPVQELAWPRIASGAHVLATAPTGTGKTLAAFLHALDRFASGSWDPGRLHVLYVSPLKALVTDVRRNLLVPLQEIGLEDVRADVRTGDTPASERRRFGKRPPSILCTTPESLNLLLATPSARPALRDLKAVILDEIHAVAATKRGAFLMTAVERIPEVQRIALSATVRPLETVAAFVGGPGRKVEIVEAPGAKRREIRVQGIDRGDLPSIWPHVVRELKEIVKANATTVVFVNNRAACERLVRWLNEGESAPLAYAHHGSLARELRAVVEQRLKEGSLKAIVATGSLELGIDIGGIDEVVLVQSPRTLSSGIQRVGRAGHGVGETSRARMVPVFSRDVLDAAVMAPLLEGGTGETTTPVRNPLDVLAQTIVAACAVEEQDLDALYAQLKRTYPYADLSREAYDRVVGMLRGRYAETRLRDLKPRLRIDPLTGRARGADGALQLVWRSGGVIPDRGYYPVRVEGSGARLGELDEEFVWERKTGQEIVIGAQQWRIDRITRDEVVVTPGRGGDGVAPFWKAESQARDFELCERIGTFLEDAERKGFPGPLPNLDAVANDALRGLLERQRAATGKLPHRHHVVLEDNGGTPRRVVVHAMWGDRVLRPFSIALAAAFEEQHGYPLETQTNDDGLLVHLPDDYPARRLLGLVSIDRLDALLRKRLHQTGFFGTRFRENAMRALLLPRHGRRGRTPLWLSRMRASKLMHAVSRYGDFPILAETWRTCIEDEFDLPALRRLLGEIESGEITVSEAATTAPSPFAQPLAWRATNQLMYDQNERAPSGGAMPLSEAVLRDVLYDAQLRPRLDPALVRTFESKLQRSDPEYAPRDAAEWIDLVEERLLVKPWGDLPSGLVFDRGYVVAARDVPLLARARAGDPKALAECLTRILATHGPVTLPYLEDLLGASVSAALEALVADGRVLADRFREGAAELEFCDAENLERLLRLARAAARPTLDPLPRERLPQFLTRWQRDGDLRDRLERLFGFPAPAALWEEAILPAGGDYRPAETDDLFQESDLTWLGTGRESLAFAFEEETRLFLPRSLEAPEPFSDGGRYDFFEIQRRWGSDSADAARRIWDLAWQGAITADSYAVMRQGIANGFEPAPAVARRGGLRSWQSSRPVLGTWRALPRAEPMDRLEEAEADKARARQLLSRYGVLFRELCATELPGLRWGKLVRALRLLELSGEAFTGHFFTGFEGLQFAARDALRLLRGTWDDDEPFWMNACDPASACGVVDGMPPRVPSTWLVYRGSRLVLVARRNGREIECRATPDARDLALFHFLLGRAVRPLARVVVETIDGERAAAHALVAVFREAGFESDMDTLVLERVYA